MFTTRSERIAAGAGNLFFLAAIIFFVMLILFATGTVQAQDALEPDALAPDVLKPDTLGPDALGLEPVQIEDVTIPVEAGEGAVGVRCPYHAVWFDPATSFCHKCRYPNWPLEWRWGRYDVPNPYWWTFGEDFVDEFGTGVVVPAVEQETTPGAVVTAVPRTRVKTVERSRSVPAVVERSPGRAQGRVK